MSPIIQCFRCEELVYLRLCSVYNAVYIYISVNFNIKIYVNLYTKNTTLKEDALTVLDVWGIRNVLSKCVFW